MALFMVTFASFYSEVEDKYGSSIDTRTNDTLAGYNQFEAIQNTTQDIEDTLFNSTNEGDQNDLLGVFLGSGFNVLKLAKGSVQAFGSMIQTAAGIVQLPTGFVSIVLTIIVVLIIFAIISVLVGKDI